MPEPEVAAAPESTATESADASQDVQTETEVKTEEVKTDESTSPEPEKSESDAEKTAVEPKPKKSKDQQKIASQSFDLREAKRTNTRLLSLLEKQQSQGVTSEAKPPKIEDFETIDEYLDARDSYRDSKSKPAKADDSKDYAAEQEEFIHEATDELRSAGSEKYEDFDDVVFAEDVKITPVMRDAMLVVDDPEIQAEIAYFLGSNNKEATRISKLSPMRQVTEIGKLEAKILSKPASKRPSAAPKPIKPVGGAKTPTDAHQPTDDFETFRGKRNKELGRG
jgi:hypothetical protein